MSLSDHGYYKLEQRQGFFIVTYMGSWDVEAGKTLFKECQEMIAESGYKKFGILIDLREWEGGTSEALVFVKQASDYLYEHGQIISVHVINSGVKRQFIEPVQQLQASRMVFKQFHSMEVALPWMKAKIKQLIYS